MRLSVNLRAALCTAVLSLVVPLSQAQAQECVKFQDLNHCGIGAATVSATGRRSHCAALACVAMYSSSQRDVSDRPSVTAR